MGFAMDYMVSIWVLVCFDIIFEGSPFLWNEQWLQDPPEQLDWLGSITIAGIPDFRWPLQIKGTTQSKISWNLNITISHDFLWGLAASIGYESFLRTNGHWLMYLPSGKLSHNELKRSTIFNGTTLELSTGPCSIAILTQPEGTIHQL